jgi:peptidyl-prolyl cis-trans isomerase C
MEIIVKSLSFLSAMICLALFAGTVLAQPAAVPGNEGAEAGLSSPALAVKELLQPGESAASPGALYPSVVATVDGMSISGSDLELLVRRELAAIGNPEWKNLRAEYRQQLTAVSLASLVNLNLLHKTAVEAGTKPDKEEVQTEMQRIAGEFATEAEFSAAMALQGIDPDAFERYLLINSTVSRYIEETVRKKVTVTPQEIEDFYANNPDHFEHPDIVRVRHIFIPFEAADKENAEVKRRMEELLGKVRGGENFAALAMEHSADVSSLTGGDLGYISRNMLDPVFTEAAFSMSVGESRIVETLLGMHVVMVTDKQNEGIMALDEVRADLIEFLKNEKVQVEVDRLLMDLGGKAEVEVFIQ